VNVKVYVVSTAEGLLKLNSNTAGLPSVAEAGAMFLLQLAASLSLIVPVAEAVPEAIVKVSLDSAIVSAVVGTETFRSCTRRYSYCLRSGSVISTSSSSIGECKGIRCISAEGLLKLNSNTAGLLQ
jgi:hypothetical protein